MHPGCCLLLHQGQPQATRSNGHACRDPANGAAFSARCTLHCYCVPNVARDTRTRKHPLPSIGNKNLTDRAVLSFATPDTLSSRGRPSLSHDSLGSHQLAYPHPVESVCTAQSQVQLREDNSAPGRRDSELKAQVQVTPGASWVSGGPTLSYILTRLAHINPFNAPSKPLRYLLFPPPPHKGRARGTEKGDHTPKKDTARQVWDVKATPSLRHGLHFDENGPWTCAGKKTARGICWCWSCQMAVPPGHSSSPASHVTVE